jgi:hypothetical protein
MRAFVHRSSHGTSTTNLRYSWCITLERSDIYTCLPAAKEYILEERFIHEVLARRAHTAYERACQIWQADGHLSPGILFWPTDTVMTTDGASPLEGVLVGPLPNPKERPALFASALEVISPYGIFTVEVVEGPGPPALVGTFENQPRGPPMGQAGAASWRRIGVGPRGGDG